MDLDPKELQQRMRRLKEGLREAGVKLTHQRLEICSEIAKSGNHPDAETVFRGVRERVPTVSIDTVYRTLWLLLDLELIGTLSTARGKTRFDGNTRSHHHFVCTGCGEARDFYSESFDHLEVPKDVVGSGTVLKTQVEVRGICAKCSEQTNH